MWEPLNFGSTLAATGLSPGFRGPIAVLEIVAMGLIATLSVAASWSLLNREPHGIPLARAALIATTMREVLALYWTRLPSNVAPGTRGIYSVLMAAHAAAWLAYLRKTRRSYEI